MALPVVVDRSSAPTFGIGRRRLLGPDFTHVTRGGYVPSVLADDLVARCRALVHVRADLVVSHWSAAVVHGAPLPPGRQVGAIDLLAPPGTWPARRRGTRGHAATGPVTTVHRRGLPVTAPLQTWLDLARDGATVAELVVVGDAMLRLGLMGRAGLSGAVGPSETWRGVRTARVALSLLDGRSESPMESWLRVLLVLAGIEPPDVQHVVTCAARFVARVDLAWPDQRLVVEYDGSHHVDRRQHLSDLRRREALERAGWTVLVFMAEDVLGEPAETVARVAARLG